MENCATNCQSACSINGPGGHLSETAADAAERLGALLSESPTFQQFLRAAGALRMDAEANHLIQQLNEQAYLYDPSATHAAAEAQALEAQLNALPLVQEYRKAEAAARTLFQMVDAAISTSVGVAFAENAKPSACG
jgi:cell fate (sporulation/competence/biofilm development) regulator YlbF (YheA/YmcA/DUF963 family)